jgi:hypothetical protein
MVKTPTNGTVILGVWRDRFEHRPDHPGPKCVQLTRLQKYQYNPKNLGYNERIKHVEAIHQDAPCLLILCEAVDTEAKTRAIKYSPANICTVGECWSSTIRIGGLRGRSTTCHVASSKSVIFSPSLRH